MWCESEIQTLWKYRIDPSRHTREKLVALVKHFQISGSVYSVKKKEVPVTASKEFAKKVRTLALDGKLDWLLGDQPPVTGAARGPDGQGEDKEHALPGGPDQLDVSSDDRLFFSQRLLKDATGIPDHVHGERSLALKLSFDADELSIALVCKPVAAAEVAYLEHVDVLKEVDSKTRVDKVAELVAAEEVVRVVTVKEAPLFFLVELSKRGIRCSTLPWMGRDPSGNIRDRLFGHFKALLGQRQLRLPEDAMLRAELGRITVAHCDTSPSYVLGNYEAAGRSEAVVIAATVALLGAPLSGGIG